jgi:hypothetical protein
LSFAIITTISPEFEIAREVFFPTWYANSGADKIVIHEIDEGAWHKNILARAHVLRDEIAARASRKERFLFLDADCLVLGDLSGGFSADHCMSVARWPNVNMGVAFFNLAVQPMPFRWRKWIHWIVMQIQVKVAAGHTPQHECDQVIWRPRLHQIHPMVCRLEELEFNYSEFDLPYWKRLLPQIRPIGWPRVVHIKGHGDWEYAQLDEKLAYLKTLWPEELACIA